MDLSSDYNFAQAQMYTYHIYISGYHPDSFLGTTPSKYKREYCKNDNFNQILEQTRKELFDLGYKESNEIPELVEDYEKIFYVLRETWNEIFRQQNTCYLDKASELHRNLRLIAWKQFIIITASHFK